MPTRRQYLGIIAGGGATAAIVSGALATGGSSEDGSVPEAATIETVDSDCGGPDIDSATIDIGTGAVDIEGTIRAPNPCHEAELIDATVEDGVMSVHIGVESPLEEGEVCVECVGKIDYEATIPFDDTVDAVELTHEDRSVSTE